MSTPTPLSPETLDTATLVREAMIKALRSVAPVEGSDHFGWAVRFASAACNNVAEAKQAEFTALTASVLRQRDRGTG